MDGSLFNTDYTSKLLDTFIAWGGEYGARLVIALLILWIGSAVAKRLARLTQALMERRQVDATLIPFLRGLVLYTLLTAVVIAAVGQLGVNITSFLAVLGAAGLAVGLALKDSLSNFASGVMLLVFRFFRVGDYVTVAGTSGTVKALNVFNIELATPDNQKIFVPNASILGNVIVNTSANDTRRIDLVFGIGYSDDIDLARSIIKELIDADERILKDPAPTIAVSELADSSVNFVVRPWCATSDYWAVRFDLIEKTKKAFDERGVSIPFPQQDVHVFHNDS